MILRFPDPSASQRCSGVAVPLRKVLVCLGCLWLGDAAAGDAVSLPGRNDGSAWPTLHGDLQRSGFYPRFPSGELSVAWRRELHPDLSGPRAEIIVGEGMAFLGTYAGDLYAWDALTGAERWRFTTKGPIGHSPMLSEGVLYFGSMDSRLYAVDAEDGRLKWSYQAGAGIWTSPVVHAGLVMFGDRRGIFHALDAGTGEPVWRHQTDDRILNSASVGPEGKRVLFGSEDMHLYCLSVVTGERLWRSRKLEGLSVRDYFPVIAGGLVFITTNPVKDFHTILDEHQRMFLAWADFDGADDRYIPATPEAIAEEQTRIIEFLREHRAEQTFYAFRIADGKEPWIAPLLYTGGLHNPMSPPCYNPATGEIFVYIRSAYGVWDGGGEVRSYTGVGILDPENGRVSLIEHNHASRDPKRPAGRKDMPWMSFNTIGDETQSLSCAPGYLFSNHQGYLGSLNLETGLCANLYGRRDTYGGFYGPGLYGWENQGGREKAAAAGDPYGIVNEWHGPARSIVSVANHHVYYHTGSQVICLRVEP